jgi:hypothetical protein
MDAPTPISPALATNTWYVRSMGATLGAVLGLLAMGALYVAATIPAVESVTHIRAILDPDGFFGIGAALLPWAVAPIAAALAGFLFAGRTMAGHHWAGVAMGFLTYVIGVVIAPLAVVGPTWVGGDPSFGSEPGVAEMLGSVVFGLPALSAIAGIVLAPLLLVCGMAGIVWAFGLRAILTAGGATVGETDQRAVDGRILVAIAILLGIGWLIIGFPMLTLMGDPGFVD